MLFRCAVFSSGIGYACDQPLSVFADEVEEVGAAVVDFAVDEEVEWSPDYGEVVVDADERVMDALFNFGGAGMGGVADAVGEGIGCHLSGRAVAHQDHSRSGDEGIFDDCGVALGHAVEHGVDWNKDSLLSRSLCGERGWGKGSRGCCGEEARQRQTKDFHGSS